MIVFFDKLFFRYHRFQEMVGNKDVAPFAASLIISFTLMLYYFSFFFLIILIFPKENLEIDMSVFKIVSLMLGAVLVLGFLFLYLYNRRYKKVLRSYNNKNTSKLMAILFPTLAFILFNAGWILKMLKNQGSI